MKKILAIMFLSLASVALAQTQSELDAARIAKAQPDITQVESSQRAACRF